MGLRGELVDPQIVVGADPQQVASHLALAELFEMKKSTAAAIEQYEACIQLDARNPAFFWSVASCNPRLAASIASENRPFSA